MPSLASRSISPACSGVTWIVIRSLEISVTAPAWSRVRFLWPKRGVGTVALVHEVVDDPQEEHRNGKGKDSQGRGRLGLQDDELTGHGKDGDEQAQDIAEDDGDGVPGRAGHRTMDDESIDFLGQTRRAERMTRIRKKDSTRETICSKRS